MKIICSTNIPYAREAFSMLGDVEILPPSSITREQVRHADILCVRSTTCVNQSLLEGSRVRFVGTATIGTDHFDIEYMKKAGIDWCSAAGCNANSVSEYVVAALLCLAKRYGFTLDGRTMGVIGVGNVGKLVVEKGKALGLRVLQNDPPRQEIEGGSMFQPIESILAESDIITLHVPLKKEGRYSTLHMANETFFNRLKPGCLFLNAARGAVVDSEAFLNAVSHGIVAHAVLDTWEGEPVFRNDVLNKTALATPHIAGHSFDGKVAGTVMIFREACRFMGAEPTWMPDSLLPEPVVPEINFSSEEPNEETALHDIVQTVYDIETDDSRMREAAATDDKSKREKFERLRQEYPVRREFRFTRVKFHNTHRTQLIKKTAALGFSTE